VVAVAQLERRGVRIGDLSRGALGSAVGGRDVHCENGNGRIDDGAVGHRVESGHIGALVRDPEGAAPPKRNAPRVHQIRVDPHGAESGDVRDQIRLNIDERRVSLERIVQHDSFLHNA
jgi:hypothetical protein